MTRQNAQRLIAASWLTLVSATAPATLDVLWWALLPAAGLLAAGLLARPSFAERGRARAGGSPSPAP